MENKFKTKNQQLKLLREKNVSTLNGSGKILMETNYNELIKKYGKFFVDSKKSENSTKYKKIYKDGTSVHDVLNLLKFDRKLANILLYEILDIEEKVKSVFVYHTCEMKGEFAIYEKDSYDRSKEIKIIVDNINYMYGIISKNVNKEFIKKDFEKYGRIPFYVLSEFITLGELYKLMDSIDPKVTIKVAKYFGLTAKQLKSFVNLLSKFRNACAHNDVVYSYTHNRAAISDTIVHKNHNLASGDGAIHNKNLFACLLVIKHFKRKKEYSVLINQVDNLMNILERKSDIITKDDLLNYIGVPTNYKEILTK